MTVIRVVDTNVGMLANERPDETIRSLECLLACTNFLTELMDSGCIAIDTEWEIITEYRIMQSEREPRLGDIFLKWVLTNQANPNRCKSVDITSTVVPGQLADFDAADHKFIRTAIACVGSRIAEAVDSEWWWRRSDLEAADIAVDFLCPSEIKDLSDRKYGKRK